MDIKNSPEKYAQTAGLPFVDLQKIQKSIDLLKNSGIEYEFRTTVVDELHEAEDFENSCDSSACRYHYYYQKRLADKKLQTRAPSLGWGLESAKACARVTSEFWTSRIRIPVLLRQAGNDTVVKNASQMKFLSRVPKAEFFRVPTMKHELYMTDSDMLIQYWERIFQFLDETQN